VPGLVRGPSRSGGTPESVVEIRGAENLGRLARELRRLGDKELRRALYKGLNSAAKPLKADARANALATLPHRGGLNKVISRSSMRTSTRTGKNPSVRIVVKSHDARIDSQGRLRHPVFAGRKTPSHQRVWVTQQVPPGWFTKPARAAAPAVRRQIESVLSEVARQVEERL
jgi:hypothetical protein